jgi:hypothetical protein
MAEGVGFDRLTSKSRLGRGQSRATTISAYVETRAEGVGFDRLTSKSRLGRGQSRATTISAYVETRAEGVGFDRLRRRLSRPTPFAAGSSA